MPGLVRNFFGREWVRGFCTSDEASVANSLDAADVATLRTELHRLYTTSFTTLDPGIVIAGNGSTADESLLPVLERFVEPDIEVCETAVQDQRTDVLAEPAIAQDGDLRPMTGASPRPARSREVQIPMIAATNSNLIAATIPI
jgi:hypothetical protein